MVDFRQSVFSPKEIRAFYLSLTGLIFVSFALFYGVGFIYERHEDLVGQIRMLMLNSWWMVGSGIITFSAAYMILAFIWGLAFGDAQPLKPTRRAVFVSAVVFASIHSFRLAYGGKLPYDFVVIFLKEFVGIVLALMATCTGQVKGIIYRRGE